MRHPGTDSSARRCPPRLICAALAAAAVACAGSAATAGSASAQGGDLCVPLVTCPPPPPQCSDGGDNDTDGRIDLQDPGCASSSDDDETSRCDDGQDNDGDGRTDFGADPGCSSLADDDEADPPPPPRQCADAVDNDADGKADLDDPGCASATDDDETSRCADGEDNDGDGKVDFGPGNDPGCSSRADDDEADPPLPDPQCDDGVDNDSDGKADLQDPGCSSPTDDDETSQCDDDLDNDGDSATDFGSDPGCSSRADDDETDPAAGDLQCSDGVDNDSDGLADASDPGCASPTDDDETSQCADGADNDGDGRADYGAGPSHDPGCASRADDDETDPPPPAKQCADGVDNDADGQTDLSDPGCASATDDDETSRCADGLDNDGDAKVDFGPGKDPGCSSQADDDETDPPPVPKQCDDNVDNDADGRTDIADPGCGSAEDDDETSACADGEDNDGDGKTDFGPAGHHDPGCSSRADGDETDPADPGGSTGGGSTGGGAANTGATGGGDTTAEGGSGTSGGGLRDAGGDVPDSAAGRVASRIAPPWIALQQPSGLFRDPFGDPEALPGYGPVMIGQALLREGRRRGDETMIAAGVRAITATAERGLGIDENPLQLLAIASAYNWASARIAHDPSFRAARPAWERYLASWRGAGVGPGAERCFADPNCFHNLDMVEAVAVLELLRTGLAPATPQSRLADPGARARATAVIGSLAYHATGSRARTLGGRDPISRLGVLSDHPDNPLAYHALSVAALARGIELLGDQAPPEALLALRRTIDASGAFMAPDGDLAYLGRGGGAPWALASTVYAATVCTRVLAQYAELTARRCPTIAARALRRLERMYDLDNPGGGTVPRAGAATVDAAALDAYANAVSSAGLTALTLDWAAQAAGPPGPADEQPLPLDAGGAFVDPSAARFAAMRAGGVWFAVHQYPASLRDPRYDFGLLALKAAGPGGAWHDVLAPRPLPAARGGLDSAGPVLVRGRQRGYPWGTRTTVRPGDGTITIHGGFRTRAGRWLRRGVAFRYRALPAGVALSFRAEEGDRFTIADFVPPAGARIGTGVVRGSAFSSRVRPAAASVERLPGWSSAYASGLVRVRRTIAPRRAGTVVWTVSARR